MNSLYRKAAATHKVTRYLLVDRHVGLTVGLSLERHDQSIVTLHKLSLHS